MKLEMKQGKENMGAIKNYLLLGCWTLKEKSMFSFGIYLNIIIHELLLILDLKV